MNIITHSTSKVTGFISHQSRYASDIGSNVDSGPALDSVSDLPVIGVSIKHSRWPV